ncbi:MAG TPA: homoserine kinase [Gemmatimonadales bacterium]|nr:homoserine kinase [Gemmatimonadales bacterium]
MAPRIVLDLMHPPRRITAIAPGSVGNVGPGLDILGLAVAGRGDAVTAERTETPGIELAEPGHPDLPREPERHASAIAAREVLDRSRAGGGIRLSVAKGLPLAGGQGGSGASAVAGAAAANAVLGSPLSVTELLLAALAAEAAVAGRHADNIAPSLLGGVVLVRAIDPLDVIALPCPQRLRVVLVHPAHQLRTADARAALPAQVPLATCLAQAANVAAMVAGFLQGDLALIGRALDDGIAEPARAPLLPGFRAARQAALGAGALGASISGAGPTAFALVDGEAAGAAVARAMEEAYLRAGVASRSRVAAIDRTGVRLVHDFASQDDR